MIYSINGEQPFQVNSDSFSVSPSESGYDLYLSADGVNYSNFATVASGVTRQFTNMNEGNYYRLMGNTSLVKVNWERSCGGGGGGGTAGVSSLDGQTGALTLKTVNGNALLGSGDIVISGGGGGEQNMKYWSLNDYDNADSEGKAAIYDEMCEWMDGAPENGVGMIYTYNSGYSEDYNTMYYDSLVFNCVHKEAGYSSFHFIAIRRTLDDALYSMYVFRLARTSRDNFYETKYFSDFIMELGDSAGTINLNGADPDEYRIALSDTSKDVYIKFSAGVGNGYELGKVLSRGYTVDYSQYHIWGRMEYNGVNYMGHWVFENGAFTTESWEPESAGSSGPSNYVIVDDLSAITNPVEGMVAYVPAHIEVKTGCTFVRDNSYGDSWENIYMSSPEGAYEDIHFSDSNIPEAGKDVFDRWWAPGPCLNKWTKTNMGYAYAETGATATTLYYFTEPGYVIDSSHTYDYMTFTPDVAINYPVKETKYMYDGTNWVNITPELSNMSREELFAIANAIKSDRYMFSVMNITLDYGRGDSVMKMFACTYGENKWIQLRGQREDSFKNVDIRIDPVDRTFIYDEIDIDLPRTAFMIGITDLTGGTPTLRFGDNMWDNLKNLKDRGDSKTSVNVYLFYDLENEDKPYAVANSWRYDGENGNDKYYFYFDDIEYNGTRYRAVYQYDMSNSAWTTLYWDTYANYIASL